MHWQFLRIQQGIVHKRARNDAYSPHTKATFTGIPAISRKRCTPFDLIAYFAGFAILTVFCQKPQKSALEA
jgi:hypothetical protein